MFSLLLSSAVHTKKVEILIVPCQEGAVEQRSWEGQNQDRDWEDITKP